MELRSDDISFAAARINPTHPQFYSDLLLVLSCPVGIILLPSVLSCSRRRFLFFLLRAAALQFSKGYSTPLKILLYLYIL